MRSIGVKLILAFLAVGLTGVGVIALLAGRATETEFRQFIFDQYQDAFVDQLAEYYGTHMEWEGVEEMFPFPEWMPLQRKRLGPKPGGIVTLTDDGGAVLVAGHGYQVGEEIPGDKLETGAPIRVDEQVVGWVITHREEFRESAAEAAFLDRIRTTLTIGAIGAIAVSLLLGILLTRALTRPISELTTATRAVAEGNYEQRVPVRSRDELGELATSFNLMSIELARSINLRRQMTADIAHELRTPISVILGHVDAMDDGVMPASSDTFDIIREEASRLGRLVEDLGTLSMADAGELALVRRLVNIKTLLNKVSMAHLPLAHEKHISLQVEITPDLPDINVDRDRMAQVLDILLSNAFRYTPKGGRITLCAERVSDGVEIRVQDTGPGIDPEELPHVFDRFYRTDKSRNRVSGGSGLGLSIAKSIVEMHDGQIWVESKLGEGSTFVIRLPTSSMDL